ncbi:MAG: cytochrome c nitrite reductase small subunit [bacterium]|nr:cytochrome c nitrite reductase small subunit [bacterium]
MNRKSALILISMLLLIAAALLVNLVKASKAGSYFSSDPKACINCHVMNASYASWQHSAHARVATCVDCHLPAGNGLAKYAAKALDGWNHSYAFTFSGDLGPSINISQHGAKRVQQNCIRCHSPLVGTLQANAALNAQVSGHGPEDRRNCWTCHRAVPHGTARAIYSTPHAIGVKELK